MADVKKIWPTPVASATPPVVRISVRSRRIPTINRSSAMPMWASNSISS